MTLLKRFIPFESLITVHRQQARNYQHEIIYKPINFFYYTKSVQKKSKIKKKTARVLYRKNVELPGGKTHKTSMGFEFIPLYADCQFTRFFIVINGQRHPKNTGSGFWVWVLYPYPWNADFAGFLGMKKWVYLIGNFSKIFIFLRYFTFYYVICHFLFCQLTLNSKQTVFSVFVLMEYYFWQAIYEVDFN